MSFSQKLTRLEEILGELQGDTMSLEDSMTLFDEGRKLLVECRSFLEDAEGHVKGLDNEESCEEPAEAE